MSSPPPKRPRTDADTNGNNISDAEKHEEETSNDGGDSVGSKKINLLDNTNIAVINPSILHQSSESELANSYANATPYPHGMIHNFCKDGFLGE